MIHETSRQQDIQNLAAAMQRVIDTIEQTSIVHELHTWTEPSITMDELQFTLCRLNEQISCLQLKDSLT